MPPNNLAPYDILIVDDSNAILSHVLNTLNSPQFRCRVARTAQSGLEQLRLRLPDLLLLDCQLDGSHKGAEVLTGSPSPHAPVTIVFSASAEEADAMFQRFEQVSSRILKPFTTEELRTHVREALEANAETIEAIRRALEAAEQRAHVPAPVGSSALEEGSSKPEGEADGGRRELPLARLESPEQPTENSALSAGATPSDAIPDALLQAFLSSPSLQRELSAALRHVIGQTAPTLAAGPAALLVPASALSWALRQTRAHAITLRAEREVIEAYVGNQRIAGVASDAWSGAPRGLVRPPGADAEGTLQHGALQRLVSGETGGFLEVRELPASPAWTSQQTAAAAERLSAWPRTP